MFIQMELCDIVNVSESIIIYNNGEITEYGKNDLPYNQIVEGWKELTKTAREMPAFGVSLDNETVEAMKAGLWVEFVFDKQYSHSAMTFEKLLVRVEKSWQGFNIVRYNTQGGYSGRCYFLDLIGKDMSKFYDILANL